MDIDENEAIASVLAHVARRSLGKFARAGDPRKIQIAKTTIQDISGKPILLSKQNVRVAEKTLNHAAPDTGLIPFRHSPPIDFKHGRHQRALIVTARQTASPVILRSLFAAELAPGFAVREGRQYSLPCKLGEVSFERQRNALIVNRVYI